MNAKNDVAQARPPTAYKKPIVSDVVHYFDETRSNSTIGAGPYAAMVTALAVGGPTLKLIVPYGMLDAERVPHLAELNSKDAGKKRWWNWPHETKAK